MKTLAVLEQCSDTSLAKSLCYLSWQPKDGKVNELQTLGINFIHSYWEPAVYSLKKA